jgi:spoIIIJ-associated protein
MTGDPSPEAGGGAVEVESTGETVGEAKWFGLRELERSYPGLDREQVSFEVLSEGERGLLGVGTSPARVIARFDPSTLAVEQPAGVDADDSPAAALARQMLETIAAALGARCRVDVDERDGAVVVTATGSDVAFLIGKRGKTIDAIQYLVGAAVSAAGGESAPRVVVDAADYRARREARLIELAARAADRALRSGEPVDLEPMTAAERKIVHLYLRDRPGIETSSAGAEPNRYVVVAAASRSTTD